LVFGENRTGHAMLAYSSPVFIAGTGNSQPIPLMILGSLALKGF
jgi:hypothetical protein